MSSDTHHDPDWTVRIAMIAGLGVIALFVILALNWRPAPQTPQAPDLEYQVVATGYAPETQLHRYHVVVPKETTRRQLMSLGNYLDYQHRDQTAVTFVFYDDEPAARQQFESGRDGDDDWERHLLGQFLRAPETRWIGRPSDAGFERWD